MKKVISLVAVLMLNNLYALTTPTCGELSANSKDNLLADDTKQCINVFDNQTSWFSITTKIAGKEFTLKSVKTGKCTSIDPTNISYSLINEKTGKKIADPTGITTATQSKIDIGIIKFDVPNSYKDVKVKIKYDTVSYNKKSRTCPIDSSDYTLVTSEPTKPVVGKTYKKKTTKSCYTYTKTITSHEENSTDNFAIRPDSFGIILTKNPIKTGRLEMTRIKVENGSSDKNVTTNYNDSSINLGATFNSDPSKVIKAQYSFDIISGKTDKGQVYFYIDANNTNMTITDIHYADIDKDDTKENCRIVSGTSNDVNITAPSKGWAGTGIDKMGAADCPLNTTVQTNVKQNTIKDAHFQKMGW